MDNDEWAGKFIDPARARDWADNGKLEYIDEFPVNLIDEKPTEIKNIIQYLNIFLIFKPHVSFSIRQVLSLLLLVLFYLYQFLLNHLKTHFVS